ncbi:MAG: hypothetical protein IPL99_12205 [Candidatus Competibacteraceae bacterium]|nr:hypothetical protein [Candidatus Competibacteraceae bacterium]
MTQISDYGILGYGVDIINNEPKKLVLEFTYAKGQTFNFPEDISIPDQFTFDPSPTGKMTGENFSDVITTARDYQRNLLTKVGLGGTVKGIEFSGDAEVVNRLFTSDSAASIRQYVDCSAEYIFLRIDGIDLAAALLPQVNNDANNVNSVDDALAFYASYGTHIVKKAGVGGQMSVITHLTLTSDASKKIVENGVKIAAEAKKEALGYIRANLNFDTRFADISQDYHLISSVTVNRLGGDITAANAADWINSLKQSRIATQTAVYSNPGMLMMGAQFYLALVGVEYVPIYTLLNAGKTAIFEEALKQYLGGINPFQESPLRFKPNVPQSIPLKAGQSHRFGMRGWMATYETYAGLEATPGAYAVVQCKSDAEPGGWTEKKVYAGETVLLRGKTPYMSAFMDVNVILIVGDNDATVYARNLMVSW